MADLALRLVLDNVTLPARDWAALRGVCRATRAALVSEVTCDSYAELRSLLRAKPDGPLSRCDLRLGAPTLLLPELAQLSQLFRSVRANNVALCLPCDSEALGSLRNARARTMSLALGHCSSWFPMTRRALEACQPDELRFLESARVSLESCANIADQLQDILPLLTVAVVVPPCPCDVARVTASVLLPRAGRLRVESLRLWPDAARPQTLQADLRAAMGREPAPRVLDDRAPTRF
jgi:hypothetical protein